MNGLLDNFRSLGASIFDCTMASTSASAFLLGTKGCDCNTLVHAIEALAEDCLGIPAQYKTSADVGALKPAQATARRSFAKPGSGPLAR